MVNIESVSIRGFKPHESTELPAKNINILTGKNNVGKTSVLEAINLAFQPTNIRKYEENTDTLVNVNSSDAQISCKVSGSAGQPDLSDYTNLSKEYSVTIRNPSNQETLKIFQELIHRAVMNISFEYPNETIDAENIRPYKNILSNTAQKKISQEESKENLTQYYESIVILERDDKTIPFIYLSDQYTELIDDIASATVSQIEAHEDVSEDEMNELSWLINRQMGSLVIGRYGKSNFLGNLNDHNGAKLISSLDITNKNIESVENYSVVLSEIEDDLRDYNIIQDLYDFSLDNLVFETDTGRYQLPYESMGDGFKAITGLLWELEITDRENQILLLEEPENHMHPGYIQKLVEFIIKIAQEEDIQFFITTHNIDLIDEFLDPARSEAEKYLSESLQVIQMGKYTSQVMDLEKARTQFEELHLDLRGE
ncbi:ATP-binding protein [Halorubrum sp. SD626R]|uniref:ATP-binding protein n=1 Tax=Halorubrum sp. SD626R TaxID=1419722 RepID=UPI000A80E708|nr:ATP-binding protein [Halorubrum sp. SD626R]TKX80697.1 ATP-binding protein [Halorubrum sp. SD626R]